MNTDSKQIQPEAIERLIRCDIKIVSAGQHFCLFVREGCLAMVPWEGGIFKGLGSTGLSLEPGLGYLIYREGEYFLEGNTFCIPAQPEQVQKIRQFAADLKGALDLP